MISMGNLGFDDNTEEVNLYVNVKTKNYPLGLSLSSSKGSSSSLAFDRSTYSKVLVSYLGIGVFADFNFSRLTLRGLAIYELGRYQGEYYSSTQSSSTVSGNTLLNKTSGIRPTVQFMFNLGKKKRLGIGAEWGYFHYLSQSGWTFYLSGNPANLANLEKGESAFSFVVHYRFYQ